MSQIKEQNHDYKFKILERTISCFRSFGDWFLQMGNLELSEKHLEMSLAKIHEFELQPEQENWKETNNKIKELEGSVLNSLGNLYKNHGNFPKAEEFYLKSLKIRLNIFGENHSNVAESYNNLGLLYDNIGNLPKAEEFSLKSLLILQFGGPCEV